MDPASQSAASLELGDVGLEEEPAPGAAGGDDGLEMRPLVAARGADPDEEIYPPSMMGLGGRYARGFTRGGRSRSAAVNSDNLDAAASALSNESILGAVAGFGRRIANVLLVARASAETAVETPGIGSVGTAGGTIGRTTRSGEDASQPNNNRSAFESPTDGSKKRILLLMGTLTVALLGAVLAKDSALLYEEAVEEGDISGAAHHGLHEHHSGVDYKGVHRVHVLNVSG